MVMEFTGTVITPSMRVSSLMTSSTAMEWRVGQTGHNLSDSLFKEKRVVTASTNGPMVRTMLVNGFSTRLMVEVPILV